MIEQLDMRKFNEVNGAIFEVGTMVKAALIRMGFRDVSVEFSSYHDSGLVISTMTVMVGSTSWYVSTAMCREVIDRRAHAIAEAERIKRGIESITARP